MNKGTVSGSITRRVTALSLTKQATTYSYIIQDS